MKKSTRDNITMQEIVDRQLERVGVERDDMKAFTPEERLVILRFLASRYDWNEKKLQALSLIAGEKPDKWDENIRRYARWTKGVLSWLIASVNAGKRK